MVFVGFWNTSLTPVLGILTPKPIKMIRNKKCSLKFYPNLQKKKAKTGKIPIYLKLVFNGKKVETRLPDDFDLSEKDFPKWDEGVMRLRILESDTNDYISTIQANWVRYKTLNGHTPKDSLPKIIDIILDRIKPKDSIGLLSFIQTYMDNNLKLTNRISENTKVNYRKSVNHLTKFLQKNNLNTIALIDFKHSKASDFQLYLMSAEVGNLPVSATAIIKNLKPIFREAINQELIEKNPFKNLILTYKSDRKTPSLTLEQLKMILECEEITADRKLTFYRDLFLFGCFTGLSVSNIKNLSNQFVFPIFGNRLKLDTTRVKTKELIVQIMPSYAQQIINKYNSATHNGLLFPEFCESTFNKALKVIGAHAKINIHLTTRISRTTCTQMVVNAGQFDIIYKRAYLGWSNLSDIQSVYTELVDDIMLRNTERVETLLLNNLGESLKAIL